MARAPRKPRIYAPAEALTEALPPLTKMNTSYRRIVNAVEKHTGVSEDTCINRIAISQTAKIVLARYLLCYFLRYALGWDTAKVDELTGTPIVSRAEVAVRSRLVNDGNYQRAYMAIYEELLNNN